MRDLSRSIGRRGISAEITESFGVADGDIAFNFTARVARVSTAADVVAFDVTALWPKSIEILENLIRRPSAPPHGPTLAARTRPLRRTPRP
ncbi:MAG: hypothetical protein V3R98_14400 [Alphaproteobacteria bacterium]